MGLVDLPPEAWEAINILKRKVQSMPVLVFPDFDKPLLLEMDVSKEGLGAVLSQKQSDGCYHPVAFGSHSLTPLEKNYHSSKLEFLTLKWSIMEHFKEYLAYLPFVVQTDNNLLTYVLTMPNLDATGHRWVSVLALFQFELEYQKGTDNGAADALSCVPISHSWETIQSLLEGAIVRAADRSQAKASKELLEEHEHLSQEARVQVAKLENHRLGRGPGGRCCPSCMPQVALSQEGHTASTMGHLSQGVPLRWNRARCSSISTTVSSWIRVSCT